MLTGAGILAVIIATVAFARLKPAVPSVSRSSLVIETVQRGAFTREVRGSGVLVPENVRWISAATDARVERVLAQPGITVTANDVLVELADPQQQQSSRDAEWQMRAAVAAYEAARAELESDRLDREAAAARLRAEAEQARLRAAADAELERQGLTAHITRQISQTTADDLVKRVAIEEQRLHTMGDAQRARLAGLQAAVEQRRAMHDLQNQQTESLHVRAGIDGVLQQVSVQAGQRVNAGTILARVAQPDRLKAEIRIAETQAKDLAIGQPAKIDTRNGVVKGHVARIDPAATNGSVIVDLAFDEPLPNGARPDLSVDATIELDRVPQAVFVARPVNAQEGGTVSLFRVNGNDATRVRVDLGRASADTIEVRSGLKPGDQVIVSDTGNYERFERLNIN
ncbi:MAG TPA: HlyD family efflux transporter periplasmic adaptor subunit [Thermoanaerobaculia bacterium]|nr:HlyD family efflux transporter periplasmic adaptor subunit [Thermoanaerobaculia bacterium]